MFYNEFIQNHHMLCLIFLIDFKMHFKLYFLKTLTQISPKTSNKPFTGITLLSLRLNRRPHVPNLTHYNKHTSNAHCPPIKAKFMSVFQLCPTAKCNPSVQTTDGDTHTKKNDAQSHCKLCCSDYLDYSECRLWCRRRRNGFISHSSLHRKCVFENK